MELRNDKKIMKLAIGQAVLAYESGNFPVGAVLVIDGQVVASNYNLKEQKRDWVSHAEVLCMFENSVALRQARKLKQRIELYTTLEPCLMCLGMAAIHRVNRIIIACPDPRGDMSRIDPGQFGQWYDERWPVLEYGVLKNESCHLLIDYYARTNQAAEWRMVDLYTALLDD